MQSTIERTHSPRRTHAVHRPALPDGPLCVPFTLVLDGQPLGAKLLATISSSIILSEGNSKMPRRSITVQDIVGAHVEVDGRRLPIADDALYTLLKEKGVELDWPYSSPPEVSASRFLRLLGLRPLVTVDANGFRLMRRGEDKRFHSGVVAIHHPERLY